MDTKLQSDEVKLLMHIHQELASDLWRLLVCESQPDGKGTLCTSHLFHYQSV